MKFAQYVGIDYSGAESPDSGLKGLRIYTATQEREPEELRAFEDGRRHWTRRRAAEFLLGLLSANSEPILVGIDHCFSFPIQYFDTFHPGQSADWSAFLEDFANTGKRTVWVRDCMPEAGIQQARLGQPTWFRLTELRAKSAKSVFRFNVNGSVGKSTHAGLPWLRKLRNGLGNKVHFWPFDGWTIPDGKSAIVEVYPRLWNRTDKAGRTQDQHDAWSVAQKFRTSDRNGSLPKLFKPTLNRDERTRASYEGWIVGVE